MPGADVNFISILNNLALTGFVVFATVTVWATISGVKKEG